MSKYRFEKATGTISNLVAVRAKRNFMFRSAEQGAGGAVAVGLSLLGQGGAAVGTSTAVRDSADTVWLFECKIGETPVSGCLGSVPFADGDEVIAVGTRDGGRLEAVAVQRPSDRIVAVHPHCGRGHHRYLMNALKWAVPFCMLVPLLAIAGLEWMQEFPQEGGVTYFNFTAVFAGMLALALGFPLYRLYPYAAKATAIFRVLGMDHPEKVDLDKGMAAFRRKRPRESLDYHPTRPWVYRY